MNRLYTLVVEFLMFLIYLEMIYSKRHLKSTMHCISRLLFHTLGVFLKNFDVHEVSDVGLQEKQYIWI